MLTDVRTSAIILSHELEFRFLKMFQNVTLWTLFGSVFERFTPHICVLAISKRDQKRGIGLTNGRTNERTHTHQILGVTHTISPSGNNNSKTLSPFSVRPAHWSVFLRLHLMCRDHSAVVCSFSRSFTVLFSLHRYQPAALEAPVVPLMQSSTRHQRAAQCQV